MKRFLFQQNANIKLVFMTTAIFCYANDQKLCTNILITYFKFKSYDKVKGGGGVHISSKYCYISRKKVVGSSIWQTITPKSPRACVHSLLLTLCLFLLPSKGCEEEYVDVYRASSNKKML
jgi:hypothetical protein